MTYAALVSLVSLALEAQRTLGRQTTDKQCNNGCQSASGSLYLLTIYYSSAVACMHDDADELSLIIL